MNYNNNVKTIKCWLQRYPNGLLITPRQVGKTTALIEIVNDDDESVMVVSRLDYCDAILKYAKLHLGKNIHKSFAMRIITQNQTKMWPAHQLYLDEYLFMDSPPRIFAGAVSSLAFPIHIMHWPGIEVNALAWDRSP